MIKATAVLLQHKRPLELKEITEGLHQHPFIDEILVYRHTGGPDLINYGRYKMAEQARNDVIYTQDDDLVVKNLPALHGAFDGTRLVNGLLAQDMVRYTGMDSLLHGGAFFMRSWSAVLRKYIERFGEDYAFYRETDRVFTSLLSLIGVPRLTMKVELKRFPSAWAPFALSMQPDHEKYKRLALARCREILEASGATTA